MKYLFLLERLADPKIIRLLGASVVNTVFGYSVYAALLFFSTPYLIALFVATIVGVIFNYFSFARLVFNEHGNWAVYSGLL
ncbi:hypothetical protein EAG14_17715 [Acidovorax sp. 1608163]|uniref:GtrA family protein n=1 Tax=Acidovorax sp. 1608163 TaxID=2478662 RepID=UPI000EF6BD51|nr:hypothetical protein EAG14_17715 [Acidovorax sp. 1608163]